MILIKPAQRHSLVSITVTDTGNMDDIYVNGRYLSEHPTWHAEDSAWKAAHIVKALDKNTLDPRRICEVGCGAGEILWQLHLAMPDDTYFDGYDISPQAYNQCKSKANDRIHFHLKDLATIANAHYDLLLVMDVVEHVENYMGFLRLLKPKATYHIFHIPLDLSMSSIIRVSPILRTREREGHLHYFSRDTALATLQDCGYTIMDAFYTCGGIERHGSGLPARMMSLLRKMTFSLSNELSIRVLGGFSLMVLTC
jgi:hypothetical protein